jgi:pseudouridine-5'-phosphate glycosidase
MEERTIQKMRPNLLKIAPEVQQALSAGWPVVALDSTVITHEIPRPANLEVALAVEQIVRDVGAVPASLAIIEGQIKVGLTLQEYELLATGQHILKAGERDLPLLMCRKLTATATTSASLAIAVAAGIYVFVTSGIGGVGPAASIDLDISADLTAIARYNCITVCAGTKAFMDVSGTLEFLETQRVPVLTYRSEYFPLFYARGVTHKMEWAVQEAEEVAACFATSRSLGLDGGLLVGVPLPESDAVPDSVIQAAVNSALERSRTEKIAGKALTPFVLAAIDELTGGKSQQANISLVKNNAQFGAEIAIALSSNQRGATL